MTKHKTDETGAREWTLKWAPFQDVNIWHVVGECSSEKDESVHVIEYSAYKKLQDRVADLEKYKDKIYDYVQCTGNTSAEFLGYHLADALVNDHKKLKQNYAELLEQANKLEDALKEYELYYPPNNAGHIYLAAMALKQFAEWKEKKK